MALASPRRGGDDLDSPAIKEPSIQTVPPSAGIVDKGSHAILAKETTSSGSSANPFAYLDRSPRVESRVRARSPKYAPRLTLSACCMPLTPASSANTSNSCAASAKSMWRRASFAARSTPKAALRCRLAMGEPPTACRLARGKCRQRMPDRQCPRISIAAKPNRLAHYAGPEIGVASTKAFTCQLTVLASLAIAAARARGCVDEAEEKRLCALLLETPRHMVAALAQSAKIEALGRRIAEAQDVLYLGRGVHFPLALEGALKLKEIPTSTPKAMPRRG